MLYEAGAKKVHVRIACPEIKFPDFMVSICQQKNELLAFKKNNKEMCDYIKAETLKFLSLKGLYEALGQRKKKQHALSLVIIILLANTQLNLQII